MKTLKIIEEQDENYLRTIYTNLLYVKKDIEGTDYKVGISTVRSSLEILRVLLENFQIKYKKEID